MIKAILVILIAAVIVIFGPLVTIWSLNTLFPALAIAYTFETWCAVILLGAFLRANVTVKK
jgi:hypothetical protein